MRFRFQGLGRSHPIIGIRHDENQRIPRPGEAMQAAADAVESGMVSVIGRRPSKGPCHSDEIPRMGLTEVWMLQRQKRSVPKHPRILARSGWAQDR